LNEYKIMLIDEGFFGENVIRFLKVWDVLETWGGG
jgi:hypothetical protein